MSDDAIERGEERELEGALRAAEARSLALGLALLRQGLSHDAHERFEECWRAARGRSRTLFHGLAQLAASYHQLERGRGGAAARTWAKARRKLEAVDALPPAFDRAVASLLASAGAADGGPPRVAPDRLPPRDSWPVPSTEALGGEG